jgi:altronate dehydratase small subunit
LYLQVSPKRFEELNLSVNSCRLMTGGIMKRKAIVLDKCDNVATALTELSEGDCAYLDEWGERDIYIIDVIPFGHKFALEDIPMGGPVIKYGETIGLATRAIAGGQHVHVHNIEGIVGRGDKL